MPDPVCLMFRFCDVKSDKKKLGTPFILPCGAFSSVELDCTLLCFCMVVVVLHARGGGGGGGVDYCRWAGKAMQQTNLDALK